MGRGGEGNCSWSAVERSLCTTRYPTPSREDRERSPTSSFKQSRGMLSTFTQVKSLEISFQNTSLQPHPCKPSCSLSKVARVDLLGAGCTKVCSLPHSTCNLSLGLPAIRGLESG